MGYKVELNGRNRKIEGFEDIVLDVPYIKESTGGALFEFVVRASGDQSFRWLHACREESVHVLVLRSKRQDGIWKERVVVENLFVLSKKCAGNPITAFQDGKKVQSIDRLDSDYDKKCKDFYERIMHAKYHESSAKLKYDYLYELCCMSKNEMKERVFYVDSIEKIIDGLNEQRRKEKKREEELRRHEEKQKLEKQREQEEKRKEWRKYLEDKKIEIENIFREKGILQEEQLTNKEKIKHYGQLRRCCMDILPELAEKGFRVECLAMECPEIVDLKSCEIFLDNWKRISRAYRSLQSGIDGEEKVKEVLALFDDRIKIISNYKWGCEHDFIIIAPTGIFTIEVKNLYGHYELTETGILKYVSDDGESKSLDIALQSKKHIETLRRNLKECKAFGDEVPLSEIICSANAEFTIKNSYPYLPVCYYNTVDKYIFDGGKQVLSEKKMNEIHDFLLEHQEPDAEYPVFMPKGEISGREEFIRTFSEMVVGVEYRKAMKNS